MGKGIYIKKGVGWETVSGGENNVILYHEGSMKKVDEGEKRKDNIYKKEKTMYKTPIKSIV